MKKKVHQYGEGLRKFLKQNGYLCAAGVCALMVAVVFVLSTVNNTGPEVTAPSSIPVQEVAVQPTTGTTVPTTTTQVTTTATVTSATAAPQKAAVMVWPVKGIIQTEFAQDKLIFRPTLGEWSVHPALDIQAAQGETVCAVMKGRVESVREDSLLGNTVTMLHEDGWRSLYAAMDSVTVTVGDTLKAGETLGTVGNSALEEVSQGPHLHFVLEKDGTKVDPMKYLGDR